MAARGREVSAVSEALLSLHYHVSPDDFQTAGEASSDVKNKLKKMGFPPEIVRKVAISMYEGEINMVIHAYGGEITVDIGMDEVRAVLKDKGPGIQDIGKAMEAGYSTASEKVRSMGFGAGMGLPNMKKYSDEMKIDTEIGVGTTVTLVVRLA